jgi:hypothetical protein
MEGDRDWTTSTVKQESGKGGERAYKSRKRSQGCDDPAERKHGEELRRPRGGRYQSVALEEKGTEQDPVTG